MPRIQDRARKRNIVAGTVYVYKRDWEWATQQPGGASQFVARILRTHRKRSEMRDADKVIANLRAEITRLKAILTTIGRDSEASGD